jgi:hypothetical protein
MEKSKLYKSSYWLVLIDGKFYLIHKGRANSLDLKTKELFPNFSDKEYMLLVDDKFLFFDIQQIKGAYFNHFDFVFNDEKVKSFYMEQQNLTLFNFDKKNPVEVGGVTVSFILDEIILFYEHLNGALYEPIKYMGRR